MNLLHVWITLPDGETTALGQLAFGESRPATAERLGVAAHSIKFFDADIGRRPTTLRQSL